ncbi:MAG TPA: TonB-dependent receptor, partial [Flavobacteriaceae bacterium]|nr:TonB-dependent receptor [Flavobacteriaceae bacterium]
RASITHTKGYTYDTDEPLSSIPPLFGMVAISHKKGRLELGLDYKFNSRKKAKDYNLSEGIDRFEDTPYIAAIDTYYGTPTWASLNFSSTYKLTKNIDALLSVDNIFDVHYKEFASGISAPGRNFSISVLAHF